MKRLIAIFGLLPFLASAQPALEQNTNFNAYWTTNGSNMVLYVVGLTNENVNWQAKGVVFSQALATNATAAVSYIYTQDFEGTGAPSGWSDTGGGAVDYDYATALEGSQSLRFNTTTGSGATYSLASAYDTLYVYFILRPNVLTNFAYIFNIQTDGYTDLARIRTDGSGGFRVTANNESSSGGSWSVGNTYHMWFQYTKGTGADAIANLWVSTNATKPGSPTVSITTGNSTDQGQRIRFGPSYGTNDVVYDKLLVSTNSIGSNP